MGSRFAGAAVTALLLSASGAAGQVPWDSPLMVGTGSPAGLSILLADPGAGIGVLAHWRSPSAASRMGFRLGLAEEGGPGDDLAVFGGLDVSGSLLTHSPDFPIDLAWVSGIGVGVGDDVLLSIPFGVAFGRVLPAEGVRFHPYVTPRFIVDAFFGNGDDLDLDFAVDLGADMTFSGNWALRFGASLGDREGLAVGVVLPLG